MKKTVGRWSNEERSKLFDAVELYGFNEWVSVESYVGTRTLKQVINYANKHYGLDISHEDYLQAI